MSKLPWFVVFVACTGVLFLFTFLQSEPYRRPKPKPIMFHSAKTNSNATAQSGQKSHLFPNVLLVINYHFPYYESVSTWLRLYEKAFSKIIICGPEANKELNVQQVVHDKGYFSYECLGKAGRENPGYTGYLQIADDVLLQWWNVLDLDTSKIWWGSRNIDFNTGAVLGKPPPNGWSWWRPLHILERTADAFKELQEQSSTSQPWLNNGFATFHNNTQYIPVSLSDIYYVPGHLINKFSHLSSVFFKHKVFLECAVPTMVSFLANKNDFHMMTKGVFLSWKHGYTEKRSSALTFWTDFRHDVPFFHPFKLHGDQSGLNLNVLREVVIPLSDKMAKKARRK